MALLTWNHACSAGVRAMDDEHGILMDAMNELRLTLTRGCGREKISEMLDQLIEFMRMHFRREEQLMEQSGFAQLGQHRAEHHRLLAEMLQAAHRLQYGEEFDLRPLLCELHDEFFKHIAGIDREYGPWLNQRAVSCQLSNDNCAEAHAGGAGLGSEASS